jgi:ABC-2 type transport system permease protein
VLSALPEQLAGMGAVVRRDLLRALSYRAAVVAVAVSGLFSMILFYYVSRLVEVEPFATPDDYFAFVIVGLVVLQVVNAVLYLPLALLVQELVAGTFERLAVSPLGATAGLLATLVVPFAAALGGGLTTIAFAAIVFELPVTWSTAALAPPAALLVGLSFAPFGILSLALVLLIKQAAALAGWLVTALSLLAGFYFPISLLPDWIRWTADVQPLTPAVDLMRNVLVGTPLPDPALVEVGKLAAFAAVLLPPALFVLSRTVELSRRRATITEY